MFRDYFDFVLGKISYQNVIVFYVFNGTDSNWKNISILF